MRTNSLRNAAVAALMSVAAGMPALGQQTQIAVRPGSGLILTRDRGYRHKPRELDPVARAKHAAKMRRRYARWFNGVCFNPCISARETARILGGIE
jgi:hypothetical protein